MAKMTQNLQRIKNNRLPVGFPDLRRDFLVGIVCYMSVPILYMYVKRSSRRTPLKVYRWRYRAILPHPLLKPISDVNFRHFWGVCKVSDFSSMFRPSKMRLSLENIIIIIKAASSDERDLAPGLTANGGFRKTGNGEQYAFKEENIEGIYQNHLYVPNFLLPAGGAMTISGYWHVDIFRKAL